MTEGENKALRDAARPEEATRIALRNLMKESAGIMALCEEEIRRAAGHTNFAVFRQRIEEAGSLLEPQNS